MIDSLYATSSYVLHVTDGVRSVAIQTLYPLYQRLRRQPPQSGLIIADRESLHTYCVVTFLLRWTDHFPLRNGCFIMFEEPFTGPTWTPPRTFIRQPEPRIHGKNQDRGATRSCHAWFDSARSHPGSLSIAHRILMRRRRRLAWLIGELHTADPAGLAAAGTLLLACVVGRRVHGVKLCETFAGEREAFLKSWRSDQYPVTSCFSDSNNRKRKNQIKHTGK